GVVWAAVADEPVPGGIAEGGGKVREAFDDVVVPLGMGVDVCRQPAGVGLAGPLSVATVGQQRKRPGQRAGRGGTRAYQRYRNLVGVAVEPAEIGCRRCFGEDRVTLAGQVVVQDRGVDGLVEDQTQAPVVVAQLDRVRAIPAAPPGV